jgi:uncharacterized protein
LTLTTEVLAFCALLRAEHGIPLGHTEAQDAIRAVEAAGVTRVARFRCALRLVCCTKREEIPAFERAFTSFFLRSRRHDERSSLPIGKRREDGSARVSDRRIADGAAAAAPAAPSWETLVARYSPAPGRASPPSIPRAGLDDMLGAASRLIADARLGRSQRWRPQQRGQRFDLRRTLRASLHTGGDPVSLRRLGHPRKNPRFVVLVDGSRSMSEYGASMLQFAYALSARSRRTAVFIFSTDLRDVTRDLRAARAPQLANAGEAWGGGTRIGTNLLAFLRGAGGRLLCDDTVTIIISDGLEGEGVERLRHAMREIHRRSSAVLWVNPHAGTPGYAPASRGMRAALPYITAFTGATDARSLGGLMHRGHAPPGASSRSR